MEASRLIVLRRDFKKTLTRRRNKFDKFSGDCNDGTLGLKQLTVRKLSAIARRRWKLRPFCNDRVDSPVGDVQQLQELAGFFDSGHFGHGG